MQGYDQRKDPTSQAVINYLLTDREVCTEKYPPKVFCTDRAVFGKVCAKKTKGGYFSVQTERGRLIKVLLYGIFDDTLLPNIMGLNITN